MGPGKRATGSPQYAHTDNVFTEATVLHSQSAGPAPYSLFTICPAMVSSAFWPLRVTRRPRPSSDSSTRPSAFS